MRESLKGVAASLSTIQLNELAAMSSYGERARIALRQKSTMCARRSSTAAGASSVRPKARDNV
jgi:hypothetical protein